MHAFGVKSILLLASVLVAVSFSAPLPKDPPRPASAEAVVEVPAALPAAGEPSPKSIGTPTPAGRAAAPTLTSTPTIESRGPAPARLRTPEPAPIRSPGASVELPRRIRMPAIGVDAGFEFVGLAADGSMDVPRDPERVAWYRLGPRPGEPGNAVVAGHVDWGGKTAVFWRLRELKAGDVVEVVAADERKYQFAVQWQRWFDADRAPVEEVFRQSGATEITLITCGGVFDPATRQYLSRLVVRAAIR